MTIWGDSIAFANPARARDERLIVAPPFHWLWEVRRIVGVRDRSFNFGRSR